LKGIKMKLEKLFYFIAGLITGAIVTAPIIANEMIDIFLKGL